MIKKTKEFLCHSLFYTASNINPTRIRVIRHEKQENTWIKAIHVQRARSSFSFVYYVVERVELEEMFISNKKMVGSREDKLTFAHAPIWVPNERNQSFAQYWNKDHMINQYLLRNWNGFEQKWYFYQCNRTRKVVRAIIVFFYEFNGLVSYFFTWNQIKFYVVRFAHFCLNFIWCSSVFYGNNGPCSW